MAQQSTPLEVSDDASALPITESEAIDLIYWTAARLNEQLDELHARVQGALKRMDELDRSAGVKSA